MIIRENERRVDISSYENLLKFNGEDFHFEDAIFFDLEHYVYKKPKCVGVFGAAIFEPLSSKIVVTQYMIENKNESYDILVLAKKYFHKMKYKKGKKYIVTFAGNNDFTVINYLFNKFGFKMIVQDEFISCDLQKQYELETKKCIGLKALEKTFNIEREGEVISGSNLAKTFHKVLKDDEYIKRMPREKINKILLYNEMDVVNLFHISMNWREYINEELLNKQNLEINKEIEPKLEDVEIQREERDNNITGVTC